MNVLFRMIINNVFFIWSVIFLQVFSFFRSIALALNHLARLFRTILKPFLA